MAHGVAYIQLKRHCDPPIDGLYASVSSIKTQNSRVHSTPNYAHECAHLHYVVCRRVILV